VLNLSSRYDAIKLHLRLHAGAPDLAHAPTRVLEKNDAKIAKGNLTRVLASLSYATGLTGFFFCLAAQGVILDLNQIKFIIVMIVQDIHTPYIQ
jgi:hypothetical protein